MTPDHDISRSLTARVLIGLAIATVVPTGVVGSLAIRHAFNDVEREVVRGNLALIRALGAALDARLQDTRRAVETAAAWWAYEREPAVAGDGQPAATPGADRNVDRHLDRMKREIPLLATLAIVDPSGRRLHGDPTPADIEPGRLTFGGYISDIVFDNGHPRVRVITQARNRTGELVGAFIAGLDLGFVAEDLHVLMAESRLGTGARLLVVDGEGRPVARSDPEARPAGSGGEAERPAGADLIARPDGAPATAGVASLRDDDPAVARALASPTEGSYEDEDSIAVYRSIASYQSERGVRWAIILEQPTVHAYALARKTVRDTIITAAVVLTLSLVIGMFLAARITRPLHQLAERADAIAGEADPDEAPPAPVNAPGEIGHLAQRIEDMARRLREREALQAALARGDRLATVGTMAASVAHEVNNPLTTVLGYAVLLLEDKPADHPDRPGLTLIAEEAARMKAIVGNLLSYSRSDRAPRLAATARADINALLRHTADLLVPQLRRSQVLVDMALTEPLPACAADPHALQQVFVNLVQNAAQAMPGGGTVTVTSGRAPHAMAVEVRVIDEGAGIAPADRGRVFEPFFTTKEAGTGTGLGLAVCKHLITSMSGSVEVVDPPGGRGACFRVVIPVAEPSTRTRP